MTRHCHHTNVVHDDRSAARCPRSAAGWPLALVVLAAVVLTFQAGLQAADKPLNKQPGKLADKLAKQDVPPPAKVRAISWVIADMRREAVDALYKKGQWPRETADYGQAKNTKVDNAEVVRVLQRRLNPDPAIDGYVRWQLLSFAPSFEFAGADMTTYRKLVATMPRVMITPEPRIEPKQKAGGLSFTTGTQTAFLSDRIPVPGTRSSRPVLGVIGSGTHQSPDLFDENPNHPARVAARKLAVLQSRIAYGNAPVIQYRDTLMGLLPKTQGVQFTAMLQDVYDRLRSGHHSSQQAIDRLVAASYELHKEASIPESTYRVWIVQARKLRDVYRDVAVDIQPDGKRVKIEKESIEFPPQKLAILRSNLLRASQGEPPLTPAPKRVDQDVDQPDAK